MTGPMIENRTFDEIRIGDTANVTRTLTSDDIRLFAAVSGDVNPSHMDPDYAETDLFHHVGCRLDLGCARDRAAGPRHDLSRPVAALPGTGKRRGYDHRQRDGYR